MTARTAAALALGLGMVCSLAGGRGSEAAERPPASGGITATLADVATAGRAACSRAIDRLPVDRMTPAARQTIDHFRQSTTIHRRLPAEMIRCNRSLLDFILAKPEALVDVWRVLGISRVSLDPVGPGRWQLCDGYGTTGSIHVLHRERHDGNGLVVLYGRGGYAGPLSPKDLTGSCLVVIRHETVAGADRLPEQQIELEAFLDVDGIGLEIVTRTLQPLIARSAAGNVHEICLFVSQFADAADRNPAGVARLADRMPRTEPADRRLLVALACGHGTPPQPPLGDPGGERVHEELAARWLPADAIK